METPSSTRRVTRSQALASGNNIPMSKKIEESEKKAVTKSRQRNGGPKALIDITNDSPIVGLAMAKLETPSSEMSKKGINGISNTPGSGEALLRGQVKTLLQKVEEEAEISKISVQNRPFLSLLGNVYSPIGLLAPTPANTPMDFLPSVTQFPVEDKYVIPQMMNEMYEVKKKQESPESEKDYVTRSLLLDFIEKSEGSESSVTSSIRTRPRTKDVYEDDEDEEGGFEEEEIEEEYGDNFDQYEEDVGLVDDLCEAISKINVNGRQKMMGKFEGKHTRFVYNSDEEVEKVVVEAAEECGGDETPAVTRFVYNSDEELEEVVVKECGGDDVLQLKGLPTPKGKHLRFLEETE